MRPRVGDEIKAFENTVRKREKLLHRLFGPLLCGSYLSLLFVIGRFGFGMS